MKISEIMSTLEELQAAPRKLLGQNFLHDKNLARWIVEKLDLSLGDHVIEIGPGLGALTTEIVHRGVSATLLEKDRAFVKFLKQRFKTAPIEVIEGDALDYDTRLGFLRQPMKVIGNLPYYMSSALLFHFIADPCPFERMVFTVQKEMADRLCAPAGNKNYGSLSLIVQSRWQVIRLKILPPSVFLPQPQVDSAVILLTRRLPSELKTFDFGKFTKIVKTGFAERRKQLRKLLAPLADSHIIEETLKSLNLPRTVRAEMISLEQWITIVNSLVPEKINGNDPNELLEVVDHENRPVEPKDRATIHREGLLHRAVHIFIINRQDELLLQRRSYKKDLFPRRWNSSVSGHVDVREEYVLSAARELREELGIETPLTHLGCIPASKLTSQEFIEIYGGVYDGLLRCNEHEIESTGWFELSMVDAWIEKRPGDFATGFLECFRTVRKSVDLAIKLKSARGIGIGCQI
jgi:16S rRNA (adenine1518-N6/adenine1519-N6)-dimethyltransferase